MNYELLDEIYNKNPTLFNEIMNEIYLNKMFIKIWD